MSILSEGLQVTLIGLIVVFAVLFLLIGAVMILANVIQERREKPEPEAREASPVEQIVAEPVVEPSVETGIEPQIVAVISAAIAAFDGGNKSLVVRSIRRTSGWNKSAREEQLYRF